MKNNILVFYVAQFASYIIIETFSEPVENVVYFLQYLTLFQTSDILYNAFTFILYCHLVLFCASFSHTKQMSLPPSLQNIVHQNLEV